MTRRIVLWRHGRTEWNATGRFQGQTDVELDESGRQQARDSAARLASLEPDLLVSSDLKRTRDTTAVLAALVGVEVELDTRLRETYAGEWQGCTSNEIAERWPDEYRAWRSGDPLLRVGGGETRQEVADRVVAAVNDAAKRLPNDGLAVLTSHGGAARLGIASLIGMPLKLFTNIGGLSNCSWSMLREGEDGWILVEHNAGTLPTPVAIEEG
ncbi:histidine phosphatase family protein [Actinobacteria bacterium YIM 96077]|uniref:Histidine phosphatase family protein n=1 Tax=Phytoactinopolyspora halophila TaxID=1981511 RepID=A0A329QVJ5_9ACTN|nr:histidine phosphatase family protein [Phytoactinopolyspora halophila]AYY14196.1 histidine phosphatase family protein [Actinobacteria bacterium YIM 96077]RAW14738.1 histidine phosphatase family protein [Phytoactinopolyspora halophila]